jgi:hypothetical protein
MKLYLIYNNKDLKELLVVNWRQLQQFDEVDAKYGIPEEEREKLEAAGAAGGAEAGAAPGMDMGGGGAALGAEAAPPGGEAAPLSESRKEKILSMLSDKDEKLEDLFDINKAQQNIYEIENKLNNLLND